MPKWSIAVDFDGVIHQYTSKWTRPGDIKDPPMPGAFEWLERMVKYFKVVIYSSRITPHDDQPATDTEGLLAVVAWFQEHELPQKVLDKLELWVGKGKPTALIYIDDRAFRFWGDFPTKGEINQLKPWKIDQEEDYQYVCTECEGIDVQIVEWIYPNTDEIADGDGFIDNLTTAAGRGQTWCGDCGKSTVLKFRGGR